VTTASYDCLVDAPARAPATATLHALKIEPRAGEVEVDVVLSVDGSDERIRRRAVVAVQLVLPPHGRPQARPRAVAPPVVVEGGDYGSMSRSYTGRRTRADVPNALVGREKAAFVGLLPFTIAADIVTFPVPLGQLGVWCFSFYVRPGGDLDCRPRPPVGSRAFPFRRSARGRRCEAVAVPPLYPGRSGRHDATAGTNARGKAAAAAGASARKRPSPRPREPEDPTEPAPPEPLRLADGRKGAVMLRRLLGACGLATLLVLGSSCNGGGSSSPRAAPAAATAEIDVFNGFTPFDSIADLKIPREQPSRAYALELTSGLVRVVDLDARPRAEVGTIQVPLQGQLAARIAFDPATPGAALAAVTSSGFNSQTDPGRVYLVDTAARQTIATADLGAVSIPLPPGAKDSDGCDAGAALAPNHPVDAVFLGDRLFVVVNDLNPADFLRNLPGAVLRFDLAPDHRSFAAPATPAAALTTRANPVAMDLYRTPLGRDVLLVVSSGAGRQQFQACNGFAPPPLGVEGALEAIDPQTMQVEAVWRIGTKAQPKSLAVVAARREAFLGIGDFAAGRSEVYRVDLSRLDAALAAPGADDLSADVVNGVANPILIPFADPARPPSGRLVSALAASEDGARLHAVNFNDATVNIFTLGAAPGVPGVFVAPVLALQLRLGRGADLSQTFGPNAQVLAVRPGRPGIDFAGPDLYLGTINVVDPNLQRPPGSNVQAALDAVQTY